MSDKRSSTVVATGVISLITFFTILILTSFSFLILSGAQSDSELSIKTANAITEHYAADSEAELKLSKIHTAYNETPPEQLGAVFADMGVTLIEDISYGGNVAEYTIPINDVKYLEIRIGLPRTEDENLQRLSWKAVSIYF